MKGRAQDYAAGERAELYSNPRPLVWLVGGTFNHYAF